MNRIKKLMKQAEELQKIYDDAERMTYQEKLQARKKAKYGDWIIHAVYDDTEDEDKLIDFHTHGMERYGLKNLCMAATSEYKNVCQKVLNDIAWSMIQGEHYEPGIRHYIDDGKDKLYHVFWLYNAQRKDDGEDVLMIDYVFDEIYTLPTNGKTYVFNPMGGKYGTWVKVEDMMWEMFGNEPRNGREIIHIDGDLTNNAIDNLRLA